MSNGCSFQLGSGDRDCPTVQVTDNDGSTGPLSLLYSVRNGINPLMPNAHRRRRRDATVELSRVGVSGVYWAFTPLESAV